MSCPPNAFNSGIDYYYWNQGKRTACFLIFTGSKLILLRKERDHCLELYLHNRNIMDFFTLFSPDGVMLETNVYVSLSR